MKQKTVRLILDCMMCDAMTPEFKAANAILLSIIRANDKSDAISHTMLAAVGKAFKENDVRKSRDALARINADLSKREKALNDALVEARTKFAEMTKRNTDAKAAIVQVKTIHGVDISKIDPAYVLGPSRLGAFINEYMPGENAKINEMSREVIRLRGVKREASRKVHGRKNCRGCTCRDVRTRQTVLFVR